MRKARTDAARSFYTALGQRIAEARQRQRMTQEALASDISLTRTSVVNIERGKQQLLLHTLVQIARALKVSPTDLIPEVSLDGQPVSKVISTFVSDRKGREWIEKSIKVEDNKG